MSVHYVWCNFPVPKTSTADRERISLKSCSLLWCNFPVPNSEIEGNQGAGVHVEVRS